jgi:two-component system phosphate regulon response regulator PhoB
MVMDPKSVIVVEDDAGVRGLIVRVLTAAGYRVESYASSEAAHPAILERGPAFLLVDLRLPGRSGLELVRELREDLRDMAPPVALLSGSLEELSDDEKSEFDYCLAKPFRVTALQRVARELARRARGKRTVSGARMTAVGVDSATDDPNAATDDDEALGR